MTLPFSCIKRKQKWVDYGNVSNYYVWFPYELDVFSGKRSKNGFPWEMAISHIPQKSIEYWI